MQQQTSLQHALQEFAMADASIAIFVGGKEEFIKAMRTYT